METPDTNNKPASSAIEQRDITPYEQAIWTLRGYVFGRRDYILSAAEMRNLAKKHLIPHSFHSVGDGIHVLPITVDYHLLGYPRTVNPIDVARQRRAWLPNWGIDRSCLILNSFFYVDHDSLLARSPDARRLLSVRYHRVLKPLGFAPSVSPSGGKWVSHPELPEEHTAMGVQA